MLASILDKLKIINESHSMNINIKRFITSLVLVIIAPFINSFHTNAAEVIGAPKSWGLLLQEPGSFLAMEIQNFHNIITVIVTLITIFVLGLLVWIIYRYREEKNPKPSKTVHNTLLEISWTAVPVLILVLIAIPSFKLLYKLDVVPESDITIKAIGHQWYWSYEYPDHGNFTYDSLMVEDASELEEEKPFNRMLTTDTKMVVPIGKTIRMLVTSSDVLHSWTIPSFGIKSDAVPGRLNETWFKPEKEGIYYGQCSELCGINHQSMPIEVHVVSEQEFNNWIIESRENFSKIDLNELDFANK